MFSAFILKYACSGSSTCTPLGTYINEPPDHTAEFSAANLLSPGGITVPKYSLTSSGYSRTAVSISQNKTPNFSKSSRFL